MLRATVLYDKPPEIFKPIDLKQKTEFLNSFGRKYKEVLSKSQIDFLFGDGGTEKNGRFAVLVSSTSWTEDEDFSMLLTALESMYNSFVVAFIFLANAFS